MAKREIHRLTLSPNIRLQEIEAEAHANAFYRHYYYFVKEHNMMEERDYAPLQALTDRIC